MVGLPTVILHGLGIHLPVAITNAPGSAPGAIINLPALLIVMLITYVLYIGISESARINSIIVGIKLVVIAAVIIVGRVLRQAGELESVRADGMDGGD